MIKPTPWNAFSAGYIFYAGWHMTVQDWMGLEMYIASVEKYWVNLHWTVGFTVMVFGIVLYTSINNKYQKQKKAMRYLTHTYRTPDGRVFDTREAAEEHLKEIDDASGTDQ